MSGITHLAGNGKAFEGLPEGFANTISMQNGLQVNCSEDFSTTAQVVTPSTQFDMNLDGMA